MDESHSTVHIQMMADMPGETWVMAEERFCNPVNAALLKASLKSFCIPIPVVKSEFLKSDRFFFVSECFEIRLLCFI